MQEPFIFFGTPYIARDTLELLFARGYVPALIVTSPDAPQGRGLTLTPSPVKMWAEEHAIPVITPEKLSAVAESLASYQATYALVVAYGKILPASLIESFPKGVLNIHYSLLPKYRGASPVEAALLHNETITGVSIQKMVYELDAGDVLATRELPITPNDTTVELRAKLIPLGAQLLADILPNYLAGTLSAVAQDASKATFCTRIEKSEGELSLSDEPQKNWNKYRAYAESPGTYFFEERNGKKIRIKIKTARFENGAFIPERIVPEGKKEMNYADFIRG